MAFPSRPDRPPHGLLRTHSRLAVLLLWGSFYENAVSAPLARSMIDLFLPKSLSFAVTPKGIVTQKARFDWRSAKWTLLVTAVTAFAIAKGLWEFNVFGIEKDAYFFNLAWASYNLLFRQPDGRMGATAATQ